MVVALMNAKWDAWIRKRILIFRKKKKEIRQTRREQRDKNYPLRHSKNNHDQTDETSWRKMEIYVFLLTNYEWMYIL